MEEASYDGVRVFVVAATGAYSFSALHNVCIKQSCGLVQTELREPIFVKAEMVTKFVHDRYSHLARNRLGRGACPFQRPAKDGDPIRRNQVVIPTTLGERYSLVQAEQGFFIPGGEAIETGCDSSLRDLLGVWLVLDDHMHVVEHGDDLRWEAIQRAGDDSLKPLLPRVLDTVTNPVLHTANDTSFGVIAPVYGELEHVRTAPAFPVVRQRFRYGRAHDEKPALHSEL